jgi:hypothetical protein
MGYRISSVSAMRLRRKNRKPGEEREVEWRQVSKTRTSH